MLGFHRKNQVKFLVKTNDCIVLTSALSVGREVHGHWETPEDRP
jgi:hypothetical protein